MKESFFMYEELKNLKKTLLLWSEQVLGCVIEYSHLIYKMRFEFPRVIQK